MLAQSPSAPGWTRPQETPLEQQGLTHYTPYLHLLKVPQHLLLSSELDAVSTLQLCVCVCYNYTGTVHAVYNTILRWNGKAMLPIKLASYVRTKYVCVLYLFMNCIHGMHVKTHMQKMLS